RQPRCADIILPEDREWVEIAMADAERSCSDFDLVYRIRSAEGEVRTLRDVGEAREMESGGVRVSGIVLDLSEQEGRERALRQAALADHRRFERVIEASGLVLAEWTPASGEIAFGAGIERVLGYTVEAHGRSFTDWVRRLHPDDVGPVLERVRTALATSAPGLNTEYRYLHADGSYRTVWHRGVYDYDERGDMESAVVLLQDVTARKQLEAQASATRRIETIGALAAGVAHDMNNNLTVILGNLDLAMMRLAGEEPWEELVEARQAVAACAELVAGLLTFARQRQPTRSRLDAETFMTEAVRMMVQLAGPGVVLETVIAPNAGLFEADPVQVQQALMNLLANAREALGGAGRVRVGADRERRCARDGGPPADWVRLWLQDSGPGVPEEIQASVFEPYFTTRPFGQASGLGLSIVHGVVSAHGGWVEIDSRAGHGATFSLYFPAL
ncbi:MAG: PAS domain-containing protein, partial [Dehalococcoidia bacterium]|nr:PAS domain-containing protein [Dehalococcoidia bacterium]